MENFFHHAMLCYHWDGEVKVVNKTEVFNLYLDNEKIHFWALHLGDFFM